MFTKEQVLAALSKVKTGADYPNLVRDLKTIGVRSYDHNVANGSNVYYAANNDSVLIGHDQLLIKVNNSSSVDKLKFALNAHQEGLTDYPTFCIQAGDSGVEKWVSDLTNMTVTYIDKAGTSLVVEDIPQAN